MRWAMTLIQDIRFQWRHGFYAVYAIISLLYVSLLHIVPETHAEALMITILYSDPSFLGFFFIGGIVLLEKTQRILEPLWVTPLRLAEYVGAKLVSLAFLSSLSGTSIALGVHGFSGKTFLMLIGMSMGSLCFTSWGMMLVARVQSINAFLVGSQAFFLPITLPLLPFWGLAGGWWTEIWPGSAVLSLLKWALADTAPFPLHEFLLLLVWCTVSFCGALCSMRSAFDKEMGGVPV